MDYRALVAAALMAAAAFDAHAGAALVEFRGSELVISDDGIERPPAALIGSVLTLSIENGDAVDVRIDRLRPDPGVPEGDVILYDLSVVGEDGEWTPVCEPEADGAPHAILQPVADGRIAIFCTGGALGKCIRMGYRPWAVRDGVALGPYWRACVKMIRADYCGDDQPTTLNNMLIDLYDRLGIQKPGANAELTFESAWDEDGAICVAHPRVPQNVTLEALAGNCPRLVDRLGTICTKEAAAGLGTPLIFNASRGDGIPEQDR
jgi:hypothetical protein